MKVMASAEPWVGNWRPHKPRGPIAALYGSPGPKYKLPGTTGVTNHNPTKHKAPAYSFGKRYEHENAKMESTPGPKYLIPSNITRTGRDGTPAFSLHSRPDEPGLFKSPGPGPASYNLPPVIGHKTVAKSAAPSYSFGGRHKTGSFYGDLKETPSPAAYKVPANITRTGKDGTPAFSLHSRPKDARLYQSPGPGPATYNLPPVIGPKTVAESAAPSYSFGGRHKAGSFFEDHKKTPSPAAYKVPSNITRTGRDGTPAFSLHGRTKDPGMYQSPGPGPASYNLPPVIGHKTVAKSAAPSYSFGSRHKTGSFYDDQKQTPSPAAYRVVDPYIYKQKPPQYSMTGRNFTRDDGTLTPGPGAHNPERVTSTKPKAPSFTFGLRHSQFIYLPQEKRD